MCEKPDVYGRSLKTGSLCPWHGGDAVQGTHHTAQTCSDMFTFIWFFRFIPRRYLRELLPVPERNETLVVLVPCAPPCEIRGPATHFGIFGADCRVVPARDNMNLDSRPHASQLYCVLFQPGKLEETCIFCNAPGTESMRAGMRNCRRAPNKKNVYWFDLHRV